MVITHDVEERYRGFLGSATLELAPGLCAQPPMSAGARRWITDMLEDRHVPLRRGSIVMRWAESKANGGLA